MTIPHAVVWLDHHEAKIFLLHEEDAGFEERHVRAAHHASDRQHVHHGDGHRAGIDHHFLDDVLKQLADCDEVLAVGPASAKDELARYAKQKHGDVAKKIIGTASQDHPTPGQIVAAARDFFAKADRLRGDARLGARVLAPTTTAARIRG